MSNKYREKHKLRAIVDGDYGYFEVKKKKNIKQKISRFQNIKPLENNTAHTSVMLGDVMEQFEKCYLVTKSLNAVEFSGNFSVNNKPSGNILSTPQALSNLQTGNFFIAVDATFGYGGYTNAFLQYATNVFIIATDRDPTTTPRAQQILEAFPERFIFINDCFDKISSYIKNNAVNFFACDFGVSSMQLDQRARGFSFLHENELDMRMSPSQNLTAKTAINELDEQDLADIITNYGGESYGKKIASKIVFTREKTPINTTTQLANLVISCYGNFANKQKIHPATKTFQAIRIFVNAEIDQIENLLPKTLKVLARGGVFAAVSFHELEDGAVKRFIKKHQQKISTNKYIQFSTQAQAEEGYLEDDDKEIFGDGDSEALRVNSNKNTTTPYNAQEIAADSEGDSGLVKTKTKEGFREGEAAQTATDKKIIIKSLFSSVKLVSKQEASTNPRSRSARLRGFVVGADNI